MLWTFRDVQKTDKIVKSTEDISAKDHKIGLTVSLASEMCLFSTIVGNKAKSLFQLKKAIVDGLIKDVSYTRANAYYLLRYTLWIIENEIYEKFALMVLIYYDNIMFYVVST